MKNSINWRRLEARIYNKLVDARLKNWWGARIVKAGGTGGTVHRLVPEVLLALKEVLDEEVE